MVNFFGLLYCIVATALMVGVNGDCNKLVVAQAISDSQLADAFAEAYGDAIAQLQEGSCTPQEAEAIVQASAIAKPIAKAVVDVVTFAFAKVEGDDGCDFGVATTEGRGPAVASATAQACAKAHVSAIVQVLQPKNYFPISLQGEADSATAAFELVFSEMFFYDYDFDFDKQEIVVTAIAEEFAKAVATYTNPEGKSYCPL